MVPLGVQIRRQSAGDSAAVFHLVTSAFGRDAEAHLVAKLQDAGAARISIVAVRAGNIVGHLLLSRIAGPLRALALAPIAVAPADQHDGIGSALVWAAIEAAREGGEDAIFVLGAPSFYERFGFNVESADGFACPYAGPHFMALALNGTLPSARGALRYPDAFAEL